MSERAGTGGAGIWRDADEGEALQRYRTIVDTIDDGIYRLDEEGCFVAVNDAVVEMAGRAREDLLGEHVSVIFQGESAGDHSDTNRAGRSETFEVTVQTPENERIRCELREDALGDVDDEGGTVGVLSEVTGRGEHEQELERYETIVEAVDDGVYVVDEDGQFTMVNEAYAEMLGYERDELLGEHVSLVVDEDVLRRAQETEAALLDDDADESVIEAELETASGDRIVAEASFAMLDGDDDRWHRVGVVRDTSERQERERELERYERIVENLPVGVYRNTPGPDGDFVAGNSTLASIFDADSVDELLDHSVSDLYADQERRAEFSRTLEREGIVEDFELKQETLDGETIWISVTAIKVEEDGEVYFDGTVQDVTERKQAKRQIEQEHDMFAEGPAIVFRWKNEAGWPVEYVSENVEDVLGYTQAELESGDVPYTDLLFEEEIDRIANEVEQHSDETTERFSHEPYRIETSDGEVRWVKDTTKIVRDETGDITHYLGYLVDITERKQREQELEARSAAMEESIEGMAILNEDQEYVFVNQAHADMYDYDDPDEFLGQTWRMCYDDEEVERIEAEALPELHAEGSWRGEVTGRRADENPFPQELSLTALEDGKLVCIVRDLTDQKERERELKRFETLFTESRDVNGVLKPDGTFQYLTPSAANVLGYEPEELVGENAFDYVHPEDQERVFGGYAEMVEHPEEEPAVEYRFRHADGSWVVLESRGRNLIDDPDIEGMVVYSRDITERKERERELQRKERRFEATFEDPNILVGLLEPDGTVLDINQTAMEYIDADLDEVSGEPFWETPWWGEGDDGQRSDGARDSEDDSGSSSGVQADVREWTERAAAGEYVDFEADLTGPDGQRYVLNGVFRPVTNEEGEVVSVLVSDRDITDRKEHERELEKYEMIVETVDDGIYVKDEEDRFTMVNEAYAEMTGYDREELVGEHASLVVDEAAISRSQEVGMATTDEEMSSSTMEATIQTADGDSVPAEGTFATLRTGDGVEKRVGVVRDITERKEQRRRIEESERHYRTLVENFPNGAVGLFDEDLCYTAVGGQFLDDAGITPEDRIGNRVAEIYPDELVDEIEPYFHAALDGEMNSFEVEHHGRDLFAYTLPVMDGDGEVFAGMLVVQDVTERREAERELRESEAKFRLLAENLEEIVWMATPDAEEFIYLNPAFEDVWGMDREVLYDEPFAFLDAVHPDDRNRVEERFDALPEKEFDAEFRIVRPDGEVRWVHAQGKRVHDEDGETTRIVGIGEDVTERIERERQLEESERRYRTLAEHFPNGAVGVYDHELRYTLAEGGVLGDILPNADRLEGDRMPDIFPEETVADLEPLFRGAIESGETGSTMTEFGGQNWQVWATPLRDADGEIFAGLSLAQDVTGQVERERELERALDLLERTERIADVGGWEIDPDTRDVFWTDHIFDILEVDSEEEPPLDEALDMYHEEDQTIVETAVEHALDSGESFDVEVRLRTAASGEVRWIRLQGAPETVDEEVVSFRGAAQDVTDRKQREQRLEELVDRLEESNKRLEQFAYAASHDLQEPLRMVSSYLQLVEQRYADELDEDGQEFIDFAVDGADRMRDMIEGLLQYSRVDTRGESFEPVELDTVLDDVREDLQVTIEESDAEITTDSLPRVEGDAGQLRQLLQNLVDNAVEYSGDERPRVHISAEREADRWKVSVSDDGIGIDPENTDSVFEVFESLHTQDDHSGTGIGLALCERIVERHDGEIWVDSEPGEGSTFSFTLPAGGEDSE